MCRDRGGNGGDILCRDRIFYVATECFQGLEGLVLRHDFQFRDRVFLRHARGQRQQGALCHNTFFPCHDKEMCRLWKLGPETKILGRDRVQSW